MNSTFQKYIYIFFKILFAISGLQGVEEDAKERAGQRSGGHVQEAHARQEQCHAARPRQAPQPTPPRPTRRHVQRHLGGDLPAAQQRGLS